jgi:DtxR family transcriptional regulator, Mn-dependent transcriptional regulator
MQTIADENYLKEIYLLGLNHTPVTTSELADQFGYAPATITGMLKKLESQGWIHYTPYQGASLTDRGREIALKIIRRHRLVETFLVQTLAVPWEKVHAEAEQLEHVLSDYLEDRIDSLLGHPTVNPHGSPIPTRTGELKPSAHLLLSDLQPGDRAIIAEILDDRPDLLVYLNQMKLKPGDEICIIAVEPFDHLLTIQTSERKIVLGRNSTGRILVSKSE